MQLFIPEYAMTEQPPILTEKQTEEQNELSPTEPSNDNKVFQNFLIGVFFGLIPVGVGLDLSSYMTHTPWLEYATWKLILAASFPVFSGVLGVVLKGKFLKALGDVLSSTVI
ncbi:MAG: hypothetical protein ACFB0D_10470 [Phormidesmis sp.]